jgi:DNA-nicking Smr family endonuclease
MGRTKDKPPAGPERSESPSPADVALFERAMADIKRHVPRERPAEEKALPEQAPTQQPRRAQPVPLAEPPPPRKPTPSGLDKHASRRLKQGRLSIDGRLDLHGMTQQEAHRALAGFVRNSAESGHKCVLVITGKGARVVSEGESERTVGILRSMVPRWLQEPDLAGLVIGYRAAFPRDGGEGALYVMLRRP